MEKKINHLLSYGRSKVLCEERTTIGLHFCKQSEHLAKIVVCTLGHAICITNSQKGKENCLPSNKPSS